MIDTQPTPCTMAPGNPSAQDRDFIALLNAYRPHAGLMRMQRSGVGPCLGSRGRMHQIEDLLDHGGLFGFHWHNALWIPMFQLDSSGLQIAPGPQRVVAELSQSFDGWRLASWFVQPNSWLASRTPIDCLGSCLKEVLDAARADYFVATA
jgi:hypothetical protein